MEKSDATEILSEKDALIEDLRRRLEESEGQNEYLKLNMEMVNQEKASSGKLLDDFESQIAFLSRVMTNFRDLAGTNLVFRNSWN